MDQGEGGGAHRAQGQLSARQDVSCRARRRRHRCTCGQLQLHAGRPGLRRQPQHRAQPGGSRRRRPDPVDSMVRRSLARRAAHSRCERGGAGCAGAPGQGLLARVRLLQDALSRLEGQDRRAGASRRTCAGRAPARHGRLAGALPFSEGRCGERDQPVARAQWVHPCRQRRAGEDVDGLGGREVLRDAQRARAGALPQEAEGELGPLHVVGGVRQQPAGRGPARLRRAGPHGLEPVPGQGGRDRLGEVQLGRVRPDRDRRVAQLPQRRSRP